MMCSQILFPLAFILSMGSCSSQGKFVVSPPNVLENGLYLVVQQYSDSSFEAGEGVIIPFNHDFLDDNKKGQPILLKIDTTEFVKLELAREPQGVEQPDKRINMVLTLSDAAKTQLADFTAKNLKKKVAIVIGGKAVTMHKVREKIDSGKLQITRCTDNACEYLLLELRVPP